MRQCEQRLVVGKERGVHSRVATRLAEIATAFGVRLSLQRGEEMVDCTSILEVLALGLVQGTPVTVRAEGDLARAALDAVVQLILAEDDP